MRFTQQDTHWNTSNMIYGDNPQKINEREDKLGLKTYSYAPQISAVVQSGNLYVYAVGNPVMYADPSGNIVITTMTLMVAAGALLIGTIGGFIGNHIANSNGATGGKKALYIISGCVIGGVVGAAAGAVAAPLVSSAGVGGLSISASGASIIASAGTTFGKYGTLLSQSPNVNVDWSKYAEHGLKRMAERGITKNMVDLWVSTGKVLQQGADKFMYITQEGVAIVTRDGKLVTAYSKLQFDDNIKTVVKQLFGVN